MTEELKNPEWMTEKVEYPVPAKMSDKDIKEYVLAVLENRVFSSAHLSEYDDIGMVFLPIAFGGLGPQMPEFPERPAEIPDDWTPAQFDEYPAKRKALMEMVEGEIGKAREHYFKHLGGVWEYMDKALPRGINGLPCFMSMRLMHIDDWNRANKVIKKEMDRRETLEV